MVLDSDAKEDHVVPHHVAFFNVQPPELRWPVKATLSSSGNFCRALTRHFNTTRNLLGSRDYGRAGKPEADRTGRKMAGPVYLVQPDLQMRQASSRI